MANKQLYLLPGFHGSATLFDELLQHLPNNITPYPLGYDSADSLDEHLENISPQLPESGAFLLAESFSGLIALALMARQPTRFRAAVLSCSFAVSPMMPLAKLGAKLPAIAFQQTPIKHYILDHFCLNRVTDASLKPKVLAAISAVPASTIKRRICVLARSDLRDRLARISTPILCLAASHDRVVPARLVNDLAHQLPNANVKTIEGPHLLLQARPRSSAQAISEFLSTF